MHGCPADEEKAMDPARRTYDKHWIPWTKETLNVLGIKTTVPYMPDPWNPVYEKFKIELKDRGHYTMGDMGTSEFPELIEKIIS